MVVTRPVVVTISHELGQQKAKAKIDHGLGQIRGQLTFYTSSIEDHWSDDTLHFRLVALGQTITGKIEVFDTSIRVEVGLPGILGLMGTMLIGKIQQQATDLLEKPKG